MFRGLVGDLFTGFSPGLWLRVVRSSVGSAGSGGARAPPMPRGTVSGARCVTTRLVVTRGTTVRIRA